LAFAAPRDGMLVFNRSTSQFMRYQSGWHYASAVAPVTGGTVVDSEARAAFSALLTALKAAGVLPA
jgi:hypothetical protein